MKVTILFKDYIEMLKNHLNTPLNLNQLTVPFGVSSDRHMSNDLFVGHVIDSMYEQFSPFEEIDFMDVATVAWELGHEPAGAFLDEAPYIAFQIAQDEGRVDLH